MIDIWVSPILNNRPIAISFLIFVLLPVGPVHSCMLHSSVLVARPLHEPPLASSTSLVRVLTLEPIPHVGEHSPTTQSPQTQSTTKNGR